MYRMFNKRKIALALAITISVQGCSILSNPNTHVKDGGITVEQSFLEDAIVEQDEKIKDVEFESEVNRGGLTRVASAEKNRFLSSDNIDLSKKFSSKKQYQISANAMPLGEFVHYSLGELLQVSYLLEPTVKDNKIPVTLELKKNVNGQRLFQLVTQILRQNGINISLNDDIFYVHPISSEGNASRSFGFGRKASDVPDVSGEIVQLIPIKYGFETTVQQTLRQLVNAVIKVDVVQGLVSIEGKREAVLRALSLIDLLDSEALYKKSIGLISFNYIDSATFVEKLTLLLAQEGIKVGSKFVGQGSVNFVPIEHLGQLVVFTSSDTILERVEYWLKELDQPATGAEQSFYIYHPKYARAADLGRSIAPLIGGSLSSSGTVGAGQAVQQSRDNNQQKAAATATTTQSVEGDNMRLVVDERANALIFYSSGQYYQELQPIIKRLDVMPKQVMLEVVIAEVKLTGSFAKGVEFALSSSSDVTQTNRDIGFSKKGGFSYSIVGIDGNVNLNLNQTDGLINVLSRPTLLVRDGVAANISVGDDIPTIGSTTSDPIAGERQTTEIVYRKTGVNIDVTPTINAQGTIIMNIAQRISNVSAAGGLEGTPAIFERTINTEVVAANGQSVLLGGLISENRNSSSSQIPMLGSVPILGHLFRNDSEESDKTELVVLVTPKIVSNTQDWEKIRAQFVSELKNLTL
ncbi:secretin N-terminal domain-containing protein [Pseudoalteromonas sp.]|uniref:secretin N-terminal domain-containing protein n=1 Tax=Pseudoalteromonas sp. TaxID=53249 RepID=UPI003561A2F6